MPRNMSFFYTQEQIRNKTKTVTCRLGWKFLKEGDVINAVEKAQGLKRGEKVVKICQVKIKSIRRIALYSITPLDVKKEGFVNLLPYEFIEMFTNHMKCKSTTNVNRIEFEYL